MALLNVGRSRPRQLSNPDGEYGTETIAEILATTDANLQWHHYHALLGPYFTAGTYDEVLYFLPLAFDHIITHGDDALDLITSLVWLASEYDEKIRHDRLRNAVRDRIRDCLSHWVDQFTVVHFDLEACRKKGWRIRYSDMVVNSEVICQGTEDLVRFEKHADLAVDFAVMLSEHGGDNIKAAWFLEYSHSRFAVYTPPDDQQILELLSDRKLLESAADVVRKHRIGHEPSPTYWNDTFMKLELWDYMSGAT